MEQLIIIVIFVAIAAANHLLKKSREGDDSAPGDPGTIVKPPRVNPPVARPRETDEERMRRFMEALGVPATSQPPRKIERVARAPQPAQSPRPLASPARVAKSAMPPLSSIKPAPSSMVQPVMIEASQTRKEPETSFPEAALLVTAAAVGEVPAGASAALKAEDASNLPLNVRAMLRNRDSIRSAMILREIIDSPRGFHSYR